MAGKCSTHSGNEMFISTEKCPNKKPLWTSKHRSKENNEIRGKSV